MYIYVLEGPCTWIREEYHVKEASVISGTPVSIRRSGSRPILYISFIYFLLYGMYIYIYVPPRRGYGRLRVQFGTP